MEYSLLGPSGVKVSKICLGTATFGVAPDAQEAGRVVDAALDLGINFFDTANVYGATPTFDRPGAPPATEREPAEQLLGRALVGRRDDVVIATKSGERRFDPAAGLSRRYIIDQVEHSLRRLGTDYIDVYYAHFPDPDTPLEQTLVVYDDLVRQGKLRYVALSNHPAWQVTQALWIADHRRGRCRERRVPRDALGHRVAPDRGRGQRRRLWRQRLPLLLRRADGHRSQHRRLAEVADRSLPRSEPGPNSP